MGEPAALDEQRGPLPLNKTLFLGYAFLLTMATTSDKLASRSKLPDGPSGSSEEEEGKAVGHPGGSDTCTSFISIHFMSLVPPQPSVEEAAQLATEVFGQEKLI